MAHHCSDRVVEAIAGILLGKGENIDVKVALEQKAEDEGGDTHTRVRPRVLPATVQDCVRCCARSETRFQYAHGRARQSQLAPTTWMPASSRHTNMLQGQKSTTAFGFDFAYML
jgi:hypothetical protein